MPGLSAQRSPTCDRKRAVTVDRGLTNWLLSARRTKDALSSPCIVCSVVIDQTGLPVADAVVRVQNSCNGDWNFFGSMGRTVTDEEGGFAL